MFMAPEPRFLETAEIGIAVQASLALAIVLRCQASRLPCCPFCIAKYIRVNQTFDVAYSLMSFETVNQDI